MNLIHSENTLACQCKTRSFVKNTEIKNSEMNIIINIKSAINLIVIICPPF